MSSNPCGQGQKLHLSQCRNFDFIFGAIQDFFQRKVEDHFEKAHQEPEPRHIPSPICPLLLHTVPIKFVFHTE